VEEIGWSRNWILARVSRIYQGDPSGWYALNVTNKQMVGPLTPAAIQTNVGLSAIKVRKAVEAFAHPK
jgi:hypothetical protein